MTIETLIFNAYANNELQGASITPYCVYIPLRVTGIGYSIRVNADDNFYLSKRDESYLKLKDEILGLPIIIDHPLDKEKQDNLNSRRFLTLSNFSENTIIGNCLNAYERDNELWALAKIYDIDTALALINGKKSTSPAVYCVFDTQGAVVVDKPMLINHLAIVEQGHWDKKDKKSVDNTKINLIELRDETMQKAIKENSISPCLVDDFRYLNKGIPNFFDYNKQDESEAKVENEKDEQTEQELAEQEKQKDELKNSNIDESEEKVENKDTEVLDNEKVKADESESGYEKDDNAKAKELDKEIAKDKESGNDDKLYEEDDRVKRDKERDDALRDKEKAKDDSCVTRVDEDTIGDDVDYGDDDKLRDEILGVMEELCDSLNDSLNFKRVVCMKREKPTYLANRLLKANLSLCDSAYKDIIANDKLKELGSNFTAKAFRESVAHIKALNDSANKKQGKRHADVNGWVKIKDGVSLKQI